MNRGLSASSIIAHFPSRVILSPTVIIMLPSASTATTKHFACKPSRATWWMQNEDGKLSSSYGHRRHSSGEDEEMPECACVRDGWAHPSVPSKYGNCSSPTINHLFQLHASFYQRTNLRRNEWRIFLWDDSSSLLLQLLRAMLCWTITITSY